MFKVGFNVALLLTGVAGAQTINPNQIRPATANGYAGHAYSEPGSCLGLSCGK